MADVKIHKIVSSINIYKEQKGEDPIEKEDVIEYIGKNYPEVELSDKTPWMTSVTEKIKTEVLEAFGIKEKINQNAVKHLFMAFPHAGIFVLPIDLENNTKGLVHVRTSPYGTTDLSDCANALTKGKLEDYAEWLEKNYGAKQITFEEFKNYGLEGMIGIRRTGDGKETPNTVNEKTDFKKEPK